MGQRELPSPAARAWHVWTEPELKDAIFAAWKGHASPEQSELLSAWVWARVTDYRWFEMRDLIEAYRESTEPERDIE